MEKYPGECPNGWYWECLSEYNNVKDHQVLPHCLFELIKSNREDTGTRKYFKTRTKALKALDKAKNKFKEVVSC